MAEWGKGDPRWIVDKREDGRNVNHWHWTEQDFTGWTKQKLQELLEGSTITSDLISITLKDLTLKGEVSVNTRKQKVIVLYELDVTVKWEGELKGVAKTFKGTLHMPYISEENDDDDFEVKVTIEGGEDGNYAKMKDEVRKQSIPVLKKKIPAMLSELRQVASEKTKLQLKVEKKLPKIEEMSAAASTTSSQQAATKETPKVTSATSFTTKEKFRCSPVDLFECLVEPNRVRAYAGGDAEVSREVGGKFKLFGGSVEGENLEVVPPKKLVQKWRFNTWPEGYYSTVTIQLEEKDGKTILSLEQTGIPANDKERTEAGWPSNFWNRIRGIFGFGSLM